MCDKQSLVRTIWRLANSSKSNQSPKTAGYCLQSVRLYCASLPPAPLCSPSWCTGSLEIYLEGSGRSSAAARSLHIARHCQGLSASFHQPPPSNGRRALSRTFVNSNQSINQSITTFKLGKGYRVAMAWIFYVLPFFFHLVNWWCWWSWQYSVIHSTTTTSRAITTTIIIYYYYYGDTQ